MLSALQTFLTTPLTDLINPTIADAETEVVHLFHRVAAYVPAYQQFLQEHNINPANIQTFTDFQQLPLTTKASYLKQHPLPQLCRDGKLEACNVIAISSGSTG